MFLENFVSGGTGSDQNRETDYTYNPDGKVATMTAKNSMTGDQVTQYVYGTALNNSDVASNELLRMQVYPKDTNSSPDRLILAYNRLGQLKSKEDQMGSVHAIDYDRLGRQVHDRVTTLGAGVDGAVLRISYGYEVRGMVKSVTSYDNATVDQAVSVPCRGGEHRDDAEVANGIRRWECEHYPTDIVDISQRPGVELQLWRAGRHE